MVNKAFGKEVLKKGARAKSTPGQARKGMFRQGGSVPGGISEHLFKEYLNDIHEGIVTSLLPKFVDQGQIENKKLEILAMLGSMYAAEGSTSDTTIPTVDLEILKTIDKNAESKLKGLGFDATKTGVETGKYKFLGDVDRVRQKVSKIPSLERQLYKIDTQDELKTFLSDVVRYINSKFSGDKN